MGVIQKPLPDAEIVFLGSGMYGTGPGLLMNRLLREGIFAGRKVALFATASYPGEGEKMLGSMADALEKKGAKILGNTESHGKVIIVHFRNVHKEDLEDARKWAQEIPGK